MIGHNVFEQDGVMWEILHGAIVPYGLPHVEIELSIAKARALLKKKQSYLIRWNRGFDSPHPTDWWAVIKDSREELSLLSKNTRNQVRRGAKNTNVRQCDRSEILEAGYPVYVAAFERYVSSDRMLCQDEFSEAIMRMPANIEFWGAYSKADDTLQGFAENVVDSRACFYSSMWFTSFALKDYYSYALIHIMNEHYLNIRNLDYVSDGYRSLNHATNIHEFLQKKFLFRKAYSDLQVVYSPIVRIGVSTLFALRSIVARIPPLRKLSVLLEQERIRRCCARGRTL